MRSGRRGAGGAPCSRTDPRPDRMGHALRQDARRAVRAEPRGGPLGAPHPALRGPDGRRDRTCAGGFGAASSQHHPAGTALRRRPADAASPGRVRHAPHAGRHLLRRLCARSDDECDRNRAGEVHRSGCRRLRQRLFDHDQSRGGYRRRHRHVPPGEGHHGEHGVHPVPPHVALQSGRTPVVPHHGGDARLRCHPAPAKRRATWWRVRSTARCSCTARSSSIWT